LRAVLQHKRPCLEIKFARLARFLLLSYFYLTLGETNGTLRRSNNWQEGLELVVIDTGAGLLLRPTAAFKATQLADVAGMFKGTAIVKTDVEIAAALKMDASAI